MLWLNNLFEPVQQFSQLYNTVQSAGAGPRQDLRGARHGGVVVERPGAVDLPPGTDRVSTYVRLRRDPVLHDVRCTIAGRGAHRARRPDRSRQVHAREADRALLRPVDGTVALRRRPRDATSARCASASSSCRRKASCSRARSVTTCASAGPKPPTPRSRTRSRARASTTASPRFPKGSRPKCASAVRDCRRASGS